MKLDIPVPHEKLHFFIKQFGLDENTTGTLDPYRELFIEKKKAFSDFFYSFFSVIPETRIILEHEGRHEHLINDIWPHWFDTLFRYDFDDTFLAYIWKSGLRHVEENIDQRFINLGYSVVKRFCRRIVDTIIPAINQGPVLGCVDKILDLCLLIETHAYIVATSRCDIEVVNGLSHQVRNPITIIGGNIGRLQKNMNPDSPLSRVYEMIMEENRRLERMVIDTGVYSDIFKQEPIPTRNDLEGLITAALGRLKAIDWPENLTVDIALEPECSQVRGDEGDLERMFYYLLENSLEALDPKDPYIKISSRTGAGGTPFAEIEVFNTGTPVNPEEAENALTPFYSSKPLGTGLGLSIAHLAARKNLGDIYLEPVPNKGTRCVIRLPIPLEQ
jgi:signal transduction histidine kinase